LSIIDNKIIPANNMSIAELNSFVYYFLIFVHTADSIS